MILFFCGTLHAATIYVDNNISDCVDYRIVQRDCGSGSERAYDTIQEAVDYASLTDGDFIEIRAGSGTENYNETVDLTTMNSNPTTNYVTIRKYPSDTGTVVMDGSGLGGSPAIWSGHYTTNDLAMDYIWIEGITIQDYTGAGIEFNNDGGQVDDEQSNNAVGSQYIVIKDCIVKDGGYVGIYLGGGHQSQGINGPMHNVQIIGNTVSGNANHGIKLTGDSPGVTNGQHIHTATVEKNIVYDNAKSGIYVSTGGYDLTFRYNKVFQNGWLGIGVNESWDTDIYSNIVYFNGQGSDNRYDIAVWDTVSTGVTISNNIIVVAGQIACSGSLPCFGVQIEVDDTVFKNNILMTDSSDGGVWLIQVTDTTGWSGTNFDNNLYYAPNKSEPFQWGAGDNADFAEFKSDANTSGCTNCDDNSSEADPTFTGDATNDGSEGDDYTLTEGGPAIGAGEDLGTGLSYSLDPSSTWPDNVLPLDQDNYGNWEIGAYVFGSPDSSPNVGVSIN